MALSFIGVTRSRKIFITDNTLFLSNKIYLYQLYKSFLLRGCLTPPFTRRCLPSEETTTTMAGLAAMINTHMACEEDVHALDKQVTEGFERREHLLLAMQEQRLNDLEARMQNLEDALSSSKSVGPWPSHTPSRHVLAAFVYSTPTRSAASLRTLSAHGSPSSAPASNLAKFSGLLAEWH